MHEILGKLTDQHRVLDLGARSGSFEAPAGRGPFIVRLDLERPPVGHRTSPVQADASALPFADACFDVVIANHSLEHMDSLDSVLAEVGRVLRRSGALYVSVPDSTTLSDRLYRWVYHGGGHVNPFRSPRELDERIRKHVPLSAVGWRNLYSSFGFLDRRHFHPRPPRRMWLFFNGNYRVIVVLGYVARVLDRWLGTRLSRYGWAIYYGGTTIDTEEWTNVCVQCGSAQPAGSLPVRRIASIVPYYLCPVCGAWNLFTSDR